MELNEKTLRKLRWLVVFTVVVVVAGVNYRSLLLVAGRIFAMIFPFLLGAAIAFILNVPMRRIEKLIPLKEKSKLKRPIALVFTLIFVISILLLVVFVVMPQLVGTLMGLQKSVPAFINNVLAGAESLFSTYPEIVDYINQIQIDWKQVFEGIFSFLRSGAGSVLNSTVSAAMSIVSGFTSFGIALIFSFYILLQKETLGRQMKKLLRAFLPDTATDEVFKVTALTERTFSHFLTGQCVEAVVLGTMFFVVLTVLRLPYALLIGVLIAFTALIPVFGAFIGCAIGAFLMLMVSPADALIFLVVFFVLQQLEGNLIYPHVVGNSVGLPSIWVLVAVTIGGSAMGIVGMLIFIPLCSVLYSILRGFVNRRLELKGRKMAAGNENGMGKDVPGARGEGLGKDAPGARGRGLGEDAPGARGEGLGKDVPGARGEGLGKDAPTVRGGKTEKNKTMGAGTSSSKNRKTASGR